MNINGWSLENSRKKLEDLIRNRETSDEVADPTVPGNTLLLSIKVHISSSKFGLTEYHQDTVSLSVHADTRCNAIHNFLNTVTTDSICIVEGPKKGHLLGLAGAPIDYLYIYVAKKR